MSDHKHEAHYEVTHHEPHGVQHKKVHVKAIDPHHAHHFHEASLKVHKDHAHHYEPGQHLKVTVEHV